MGVRNASVSTTNQSNTTLNTSNETIVLTSPFISLPLDNALVLIFWQFYAASGTSGTTLTLRIRRGSALTDALVMSGQPFTAAAGATFNCAGHFIDTPGVVGPVQYTVTAQNAGSSTTGGLFSGCLSAMVL